MARDLIDKRGGRWSLHQGYMLHYQGFNTDVKFLHSNYNTDKRFMDFTMY